MLALNYKVPGSDDVEIAMHLGFDISGFCRDIIAEFCPDLQELTPFSRKICVVGHRFSEGWICVRVSFLLGCATNTGSKIDDQDLEFLRSCLAPFAERSYETLVTLLGGAWAGKDTFTYFGPCDGSRVSWPHITEHTIKWLENLVIPDALDRNRARILRAIPSPPVYDLDAISTCLWVLESEEACIQGTAFSLDGSGLITCAHVIGPATKAFRWDNVGTRHPVTVLKEHSVIDLAVLSIGSPCEHALKRGDSGRLQYADHLLVAGHPNYRLGDSPIIAPGLVVGFRTVSSIRRILTNAPIVCGGSGGPVLNAQGEVVGVAVTGADSLSGAPDTEDKGLIPIDALDLL